MVSNSSVNGGSSAVSVNMTAAERLKEKHEADAAHRAMVEDVVDEEDIVHPPPSMQIEPEAAPVPILESASEPMSERAAGKQRANNENLPPSAHQTSINQGPFDTQSEESFPALGSGPKPPNTAPRNMAWGAQKPSSVHAVPNGTNGHIPLSSMPSSRASTPTSGILTPTSTNVSVTPQHRGMSFPQTMAMPGRHSERISLTPAQLLPRNQLKKPLQETLRAINKSSKAKVDMKTGANGSIIFEGFGPVDATRQALKDLAKEVGSKQHVKVPVPLSVRPYVIGRSGAVIQGISKRTGARVQLPKVEDQPVPGINDDDGTTVDVSIEGDAVAAEMARREIEAIVNERTSTVNMRLKDIPAEFYPFIAGAHNSRIENFEKDQQVRVQVPHYQIWSDQEPPQPPPSGLRPQFIPSPSHQIRISGDRLRAQEVRAEIERHVEQLHREITLSQIPIARGQHQFILENKDSLHDFLNETGCAIIMPPASESTDLLTVTGPQDMIDKGLERIYELATAMRMDRIDVARQHATAPLGSQAHARALARYLQQRRAIQKIEQDHSARVVLPGNDQGSSEWELYFKEGKNGIKARGAIVNLINAHPPSRLSHLRVDPFFHQHIHQQGARRIRDDFGVHLVSPEERPSAEHLILVYEGPVSDSEEYQFPKQIPSQQDIANFERNLQQAQQHLLSLIQGQQDIGAARVEVPRKYHEKVRKYVRREQQDLPPNEVPVQVELRPSVDDQECFLRGPANAVEALAERVNAFVEAEKHDELERGHVTSFEFPQKYANYLIGKRGETINKYREEFDVDIQVKDGKVDITGPRVKALAAKAKILALNKKLEDEATHVVRIAPKYHSAVIGAKGSQVNRLQDRYNVRIQFPRSMPATGDDNSVVDDASEVGGPRNRRPNQGSDEVIVRGPNKGADAARDELLNLLQWTIDNSYSSSVSVAQRQLPSLIGQGGQEMESLRLTTGAQIDVPGRDAVDSTGRVQIHIKGSKKQVDEAKKILEQRAKVFDDTIVRSITVDSAHHKSLIGSGGSNIRNIVVEAGGSDDRRDLARTVRFPRQDSNDNTVRIEGNKALVDKIVASIEAFTSHREGQTTAVVEVAPEKHRLLIGRAGETRRALESKFRISLDIPKLALQGPERSQIKISGQPSDVQQAKTHVLGLVKDQEGETFAVPRKYHHTVSDNGQFFRRLRSDHKVTVDHGGQQPPRKSAILPRNQTDGTVSMPLITDDQDSSIDHSWHSVENAENDEAGDIPWILRGSSEGVAKAKAILEKAIKQAESQQSQSTGYLVLPDPKTYRFIIGQGGSQINQIRKQTGCKITVPRDQSQGSPIEIVGSQDGVVQARDIILDIVQNGGRKD